MKMTAQDWVKIKEWFADLVPYAVVSVTQGREVKLKYFSTFLSDALGFSRQEFRRQGFRKVFGGQLDLFIDALLKGKDDFFYVLFCKAGDGKSFRIKIRKTGELYLLAFLESGEIRDSLTNLYNEGAFRLLAAERIEVARRATSSVFVFYLDLDNFKAINDHLGHAVGDQVIACLGITLQTVFRRSDLVSRFHGDEFVALVTVPQPEKFDPEGPKSKIKNLFLGALWDVDRSIDSGVAIGWVCHDFRQDQNCDINRLIDMADEAMYQDKQHR